MAWRLSDLVVEGEIDNTTKGLVKGWIQFSDRPDQVRLFLKGDCHPDLAGWRFRVKRLREVPDWADPADSTEMAAEQIGEPGDITADQTLKDCDCSVEELLSRTRAGEPPPHLMRKALYFEWYSHRNGRVVIQDTRLGVERLGERAFELTEEDLRRKREEAERERAELAEQGYVFETESLGPEPYWPTDEEIEQTFGPEVLAVCLDPQQGSIESAFQGLPELELLRAAEPFPGLEIVDDLPGLGPSRPRHRKVRELFDPPLSPPAASKLTPERAAIELRKTELLLLLKHVRIEVCSHFDPKFALEWAECSVLWANVPESLADEEEVTAVTFFSSDNCEKCRDELGDQWRAPR